MSSTESFQNETATASSSSHQGHFSAEKDRPTKTIVQEALDANKRLQLILAERAEQLEAELKEADRLIQASNTDDADEDPETEVLIPGAKKVAGLFASSEFLNASSPFYDEAKKRSAYLANTTPHPMKSKDLEVLADAVRQENQRLQAYARLEAGSGSNVDIDLENNLEGLDWARISEKVSDSSSVKRTPTECRVTWIGDRHPRINHAAWSTAETKKLETIVSEYVKAKQPVDWVKVAEHLGTSRTPIDCMRHGLPPHRHTWSPESDKELLKAVATCGIDNWQLVAKSVSEYATASQCQVRWQKTLDPGIRRGAWTEEEDERLRKAVVGYGKSWVQVSTVMSGRTNDQCRERWTEHITSSSDKMTWSEEEDELLTNLVEELGKQWKTISLKLGGNKTGQNCRFRYDKLKRASSNFKNTPQGTPSLSVVNTPTIPNFAGPSQLVSTHLPETTSTIFTFAPNLGQHSFAQPSISSNNDFAVNDPLPDPQAVDTNTNAKDVEMHLSGTTEQILSASDQLGVVKDPPNVPNDSRKEVPEASQGAEGIIPPMKLWPKPLPKLSKIAGRATHPPPAEDIGEPDVTIDSPLTDDTSSSIPSASSSAKASAPTKGRKRKAVDFADPEKSQRPKKKARSTKAAPSTAVDKATEIASEAQDISLSLEPPATTIAMRTETSDGLNPNDSPVTENPQPQLRRGRSRKIVTQPDDHTSVQPEQSASVAPSNPLPKRPRGRPRKVQPGA